MTTQVSKDNPVRLVLFASGSGSNVENIVNHFADKQEVEITAVYCNKEGAGVLDRAKRLGIPSRVFSRTEWRDPEGICRELVQSNTDLIVLAGFLWLVPAHIVSAFAERIINIHPALLPKYGGKGMYGHHVHEAVVAHGEKETGITIHYVNEHYDEGAIIFQKSVALSPADSPNEVAQKVHQLEYAHFPQVIEEILHKKGKIG